jgi:YHS domain-containing protein
MIIDPVCEMKISENSAVATSMYKGKIYYFCSILCKQLFDRNPEIYLQDHTTLEPLK